MATMDLEDPDGERYNPDQATPNSGVTGWGTPGTPGTPAPTPQPTDNRTGIASAYKQYLGRDITDNEYGYWTGNNNYADAIKNSAEAQQYARTGQGGNYWNPGAAPQGFDAQKWQNPTQGTTNKYTVGRILAAGGSIEHAAQAVGGKVIAPDKIQYPDGFIADVYFDYGGPNQRVQYTQTGGPGWQGVGDGTSERAMAGGGRGGMNAPSADGSAFSDPATSQWEQLLRNMVNRLNTGVPDSARELQQTQALDPLERQKQQMRQQESLRLSQRGIQPGSGVYDDAMRNIDRQFNELRTRTQASFANSWAQNEDSRMLNAVNLFKQIPQYQDTRLQLAQGTMIPENVGSLLTLQQQNGQWNQQQQQQFWQNLAMWAADQFRQNG